MRQREPKGGVICPECGDPRSRVESSRRHRDGKNVRVRTCQACGRRYVTTERVTG